MIKLVKAVWVVCTLTKISHALRRLQRIVGGKVLVVVVVIILLHLNRIGKLLEACEWCELGYGDYGHNVSISLGLFGQITALFTPVQEAEVYNFWTLI